MTRHFFLLTAMLVISACSQTLDPKIKAALIKGHSGTCLPTIAAQIANLGLDAQSEDSIAGIKEYCSCVGHKYFDDFTIEDNQWLESKGSLPPRIAAKRSQYQMECSD
jgi:hypothetical protein